MSGVLVGLFFFAFANSRERRNGKYINVYVGSDLRASMGVVANDYPNNNAAKFAYRCVAYLDRDGSNARFVCSGCVAFIARE